MLTLLFSFLFMLCFIWNSETAVPETAEAVRLFLFAVLPAVFPFCVLAELLTRTHAFARAGRLFAPWMRPLFGVSGAGALAVLIGLVGSYPTGAKTTASLYQSGAVTKEEALALSAFTNNAGPLFIVGVVGAVMLGSVRLGLLLWGCHIAASLFTGLLQRLCTPRRARYRTRAHASGSPCTPATPPASGSGKAPGASFAGMLAGSIASAAQTMIPVAGTVLFFAALCASLHFTQIPVCARICTFARMLLEMTSGTHAVAGLTGIGLLPRCALYAAVLAWGGVSVHMQTLYVLSESGLPCRRYLLGKAVHTVLAVLLTCGALMLAGYR